MSDTSTYTIGEVVAMFPGMTEHWLRKAVRENRVNHLRIGARVVLFTADHVAEMRKQFEVKARKR